MRYIYSYMGMLERLVITRPCHTFVTTSAPFITLTSRSVTGSRIMKRKARYIPKNGSRRVSFRRPRRQIPGIHAKRVVSSLNDVCLPQSRELATKWQVECKCTPQMNADI